MNDERIRVLLVDDESEFLKAMTRSLERRGFAVTGSETAAAARAAVAADPGLQVAVLDVRLPDGDGHDLFAELKLSHPELQAIILTGNRDENKSFRLSHQGLFDYLDKPVEPDVLAAAITSAWQKAREENEEPSTVDGAGKVRVLIIDDEADFLRSLTRVLARRGMTILPATSGEEGLAILDREEVDVAIIDLKMPGLSGMETLRELKKRRPEVQAIILTGHATVETGIEGMRDGAADYLFKPQDPDDLAKRILEAAARGTKSGKRKWWRK